MPNLCAFCAPLERQATALRAGEEIPCIAIVVADPHQLLYAKGFGVREMGKPMPVTPDTAFQIGSATQSFLATTAAKLGREYLPSPTKAVAWAGAWFTRRGGAWFCSAQSVSPLASRLELVHQASR